MRTIGKLASEAAAARFSDFLYVRGIENEFEPEDDGTFSLWIMDEAQMAQAADLLAGFRSNPDAPAYDSTAVAEKQRQADAQSGRASRATVADADRIGYERAFQATPYFTYALIVISVAVAVYSKLGENAIAIHHLFIADFDAVGDYARWHPGFADVRSGQVWRLVTPIFIHFGLPHILFNMMMLKDVGTFVESRFGGWYLLGLVAVSGALSNVGQYFWGGPIFGGMSGVVYALFGFLWMRGKHDRTAGWHLNPQTVYWLIGWFVICLVGIIPHVANACHAVGLAIGMAWGWLSARMRFSR